MEWHFVGRKSELDHLTTSLRTGVSVLLTGAAGVGKSRLATEAAAALGRTVHVERLIGSPSIRQLPFGAVAHLMSEVRLSEPSLLVGFLGRIIQDRASGKPLVVLVDDINQVDDGSLALLEYLLAQEAAAALATVRTEGVGDARILPLWKDGILQRVDVEPLTRDETEELTASILGRPSTAQLSNEIWRLTEGHPLYVREVLFEAVDRGSIAEREGVFGLARPLTASQRVSDMVRTRTGHLDEAELGALQVIALSEPVALQLAKRFVAGDLLVRLEQRGMLRVEAGEDGPVLRTAHPLIAEVTLAQMQALTRAATTSRIANVLLDAPSVASRSAMQACIWLLDAGEDVPQGAAIQGARAALASFDHPLARRLAGAALAGGESQEALVLLGQAVSGCGNPAEAVERLVEARRAAADDAQATAAALALAEVYMFKHGEVSQAMGEIEATLEQVTDPGLRAELNSHLMLAAGLIGDFDLGLRIGPEFVDRTDVPGPAQLTSIIAMTLTQTMTGKLDQVLDRLDRGERLAVAYRDMKPFAPDQVGLNRILALQALCDLEAAEAFGKQAVRRGVGLPGPWLTLMGLTRQLAGDIDGAQQLLAEARNHLEALDPLGSMPMTNAVEALFAAMGGDEASALRLIDRVRSDPRGAVPRSAVWADRAEGWLAANAGQTDVGAELVRRAGLDAIAGTHVVWGALALHDAVRFGHAELVAADLSGLQLEVRGPLVDLLADHAVAVAGADLEGLRHIAERSAKVGASALEAESWAAVAQLTSGAQRARAAHVALHRRRACPGLNSPWFEDLAPPLSPRQDQIAALAAGGASSKGIANRLHLSARTVDNHLRSVYATFGIAGRHELPAFYPDEQMARHTL